MRQKVLPIVYRWSVSHAADEIRLVIRRPQYIRPKNWCIFGQFRIVYFIGQNTDLNNRLVDYFSRQGTFTFEKKVNEAGKTKSKLRFWCTKLEQLTTYQDATTILAYLNLMPAGAADSSKQTESTMADETDPDLEGSENMSDIPVSDENEDDKDEHEKPPSMINDEPVQVATEVEKMPTPKLDAKMRKDAASEILVEPETQKHHHRRREDRKQKPALILNYQTERQNSQTKMKRAEKRAATTNSINDESEGIANDGAKAKLTDLDPIEAYVTNYVRKLEKDANWAAHALKDIFPDIVGFLRTNMQQWIIGGKVPATTVSDEKDIKGVPIISVNNHWMVLHDDLNEWFLYKCNYADAKLRSYLSIQTLGIDICATYIRQQIEAKKVKEENAEAKTTAVEARPMKRIKKEPIEAADR